MAVTVTVLHTGDWREVFRAEDGRMNSIKFSSDGRYLASGDRDGVARLRIPGTWKEVFSVTNNKSKGFTCLALSSNSTYLAAGTVDGAWVWPVLGESEGGAPVAFAQGDWITAVSFSPDGSRLATASDKGLARVWNVSRGDELARIVHSALITSLAFSPDGQRLATGSWDTTARVWETEGCLTVIPAIPTEPRAPTDL